MIQDEILHFDELPDSDKVKHLLANEKALHKKLKAEKIENDSLFDEVKQQHLMITRLREKVSVMTKNVEDSAIKLFELQVKLGKVKPKDIKPKEYVPIEQFNKLKINHDNLVFQYEFERSTRRRKKKKEIVRRYFNDLFLFELGILPKYIEFMTSNKEIINSGEISQEIIDELDEKIGR